MSIDPLRRPQPMEIDSPWLRPVGSPTVGEALFQYLEALQDAAANRHIRDNARLVDNQPPSPDRMEESV